MSSHWRGVLQEHLRAETARAVEFARLHPVPEWASVTTTTPARPAVGWLTRHARRTNRRPA